MCTNEDLQTERIFPDEEFWLDCVSRARLLFENAILPELLGKIFSRPPDQVKPLPTSSDAVPEATSNKVYCYCQGPETDDMVGCDREECPYKWFHLSCLKLKTFPTSKFWYCPDCRKINKQSKKQKKS